MNILVPAIVRNSRQLFERVETAACNPAEEQQNSKCGKLYPDGGKGVVGGSVLEYHPAERLETAAAFACDVGDMASPIGPAGIVCKLGVDGFVNPRADTAARVLES